MHAFLADTFDSICGVDASGESIESVLIKHWDSSPNVGGDLATALEELQFPKAGLQSFSAPAKGLVDRLRR